MYKHTCIYRHWNNTFFSEVTTDILEPSHDVDDLSQDSMGASGELEPEPEQDGDSQDSIGGSREPAEQDANDLSRDSMGVSGDVEEDVDSQDSLIKEIQREVSADNFDENLDNTAAIQQEDAENDIENVHDPEAELHNPEAEQVSPEVEETNDDNVENLAVTSDTQDSAGNDTNLVDLDEDLSSSPKGIIEDIVDAADTQDSIEESTDMTSDGAQPDTVSGEMESMQALYENVDEDSLDSKENQDSHESDKVDKEKIEKSDSIDVNQFLNDREPVNTEEDHVTEETGAKDDNVIEADNTESTSEPIITGVMSLEGIDFDSNDANTEQMEIEDTGDNENQMFGTERSEVSELTTKKSEEIEAVVDEISAKDTVEEIGEEKTTESQKDDTEMTEADEDKLLEETEEEKKGRRNLDKSFVLNFDRIKPTSLT